MHAFHIPSIEMQTAVGRKIASIESEFRRNGFPFSVHRSIRFVTARVMKEKQSKYFFWKSLRLAYCSLLLCVCAVLLIWMLISFGVSFCLFVCLIFWCRCGLHYLVVGGGGGGDSRGMRDQKTHFHSIFLAFYILPNKILPLTSNTKKTVDINWSRTLNHKQRAERNRFNCTFPNQPKMKTFLN